jgi:hypothetical protein
MASVTQYSRSLARGYNAMHNRTIYITLHNGPPGYVEKSALVAQRLIIDD